MIAVAVVYLGILIALLGLVAVMRPLRAIGLTSRSQGLAVLLAGLLLVVVGAVLPAPETRVASTAMRLDEFAPRYQFSERHTLRVQVPPEAAYQAVMAVTADEIRFFNALTWVRRLGRSGPESIMNAPGQRPLLEVATRTTFLELAEEPGGEVVVGALVAVPQAGQRPRNPEAFKEITAAGFAKAAMNFRVESDGRGGSIVSTETRVFATDAATRRRFAAYWRVIYPGSALIRRSWLAAIRRRAERAESTRADVGGYIPCRADGLRTSAPAPRGTASCAAGAPSPSIPAPS